MQMYPRQDMDTILDGEFPMEKAPSSDKLGPMEFPLFFGADHVRVIRGQSQVFFHDWGWFMLVHVG